MATLGKAQERRSGERNESGRQWAGIGLIYGPRLGLSLGRTGYLICHKLLHRPGHKIVHRCILHLWAIKSRPGEALESGARLPRYLLGFLESRRQHIPLDQAVDAAAGSGRGTGPGGGIHHHIIGGTGGGDALNADDLLAAGWLDDDFMVIHLLALKWNRKPRTKS